MPITQTSWLTNLTEGDLTENLSSAVSSISDAIRNNNNEIDELVEERLTSVKNAIAAISDDISNLESSMPTSLIGSAADAYGTASTGTVMGKLNYLIYLIAPTPSTFNYTAAGTYNNITIPTGVKFISITACGGSGGGRVGTFFNPCQGDYRPYNASYVCSSSTGGMFCTHMNNYAIKGVQIYNTLTNSNQRNDWMKFWKNPGQYNYNAYGRRVNFITAGYYNYWSNFSGSCYGTYNYYYIGKNICKLVQIANNVTTAGGNAGITATVSTQSLNVAPAEIITVTVGAGGGNSASGAASTVTGTNGTKSFSGSATGAAGNTVTYANWYTLMNLCMNNSWAVTNDKTTNASNAYSPTHYLHYYGGMAAMYNPAFNKTITSARQGTMTVTGSAGKTSSANSLGKAGGKGGTGATKTYLFYTNGLWNSYANAAGGAGANGGSGYVRVAW